MKYGRIKMSLLFLMSITISIVIEDYYFGFGFFTPTPKGLVHDITFALFTVVFILIGWLIDSYVSDIKNKDSI